MNRSRNILLIAAGTFVALCLCFVAAGFIATRSAAWALARTFENDPAQVQSAGNAIADYTLPAGYGEATAASFSDYSLVSYTGTDGRSHIFLFQVPGTLNLDDTGLERQMHQVSGAESWAELAVVERIPVEIRGQETILVVSEGTSHDNQPYRSATAVFEGRGGPALVTISAPAASWDQATVDRFISSIR